MVAFEFTGLGSDGPPLRDDSSVYYSLVAAHLRLKVDGVICFEESEIPVVELAEDLQTWLGKGMGDGDDFYFKPTGYAEDWALCLSKSPTGWAAQGWGREALKVPDADGLTSGIEMFLAALDAEMGQLGYDLNGLLRRLRDRGAM